MRERLTCSNPAHLLQTVSHPAITEAPCKPPTSPTVSSPNRKAAFASSARRHHLRGRPDECHFHVVTKRKRRWAQRREMGRGDLLSTTLGQI